MDVTITRLGPMYYASAYGFGESPELVAIENLTAWAGPKGLLKPGEAEVYGFNNPFPTETRPRYGYELWLKVPPDTEPEGVIRIGEFFGGRYAVTRCEGAQNIFPTWQQLAAWLETSDYEGTGLPGLEKHVSPFETPFEEYVFELYAPVRD